MVILFSTLLILCVGTRQGTRLGSILWLFHVNDIAADGFNSVNYADKSSFYRPVEDSISQNVVPDILAL